MCSWEKIKTTKILLPVDENGEIDYAFMETYIRAMEKIVIRQLVDWNNLNMRKLKEFV